MLFKTSAASLAIALAASSALAQPAPTTARATDGGWFTNSGNQAWNRPSARWQAFVRLRAAMRDLREEAIALQEGDGGTLTAEHRASVQQRLDRIQANYRAYRDAPW